MPRVIPHLPPAGGCRCTSAVPLASPLLFLDRTVARRRGVEVALVGAIGCAVTDLGLGLERLWWEDELVSGARALGHGVAR